VRLEAGTARSLLSTDDAAPGQPVIVTGVPPLGSRQSTEKKAGGSMT